MTINKQSASYKIAHTMYLSLGGDPEKEFTSVEEIYQDVDQIYGESGGRVTVEPLKVELTTNGTTVFDDANITGYKPVEVSVNVDVGTAYDDGYNTGVADQKGKLESISITENGTYNREDGYNQVEVNVQGKLEVPFEEIGYNTELNTQLNSKIISDLEYSKYIKAQIGDNVTTAFRLFYDDHKLVYMPKIDFDNVTNMGYMCNGCWNLEVVPPIDTSNVTNMSGAFRMCYSLKNIPPMDTSNVTDMSYLFQSNYVLESIPALDASKVENISTALGSCESLVNFGGFINLGMQPNLKGTEYLISSLASITHESILNIFNNLYDRASAGYSILTINLGYYVKNKLTEEDIAIATNKGWLLKA